MEEMSTTELLIWTEQDRENILKIYGRTVETVKDDVKIVREWMEQQKHLPAVLKDIEIERFLCINKFRFEKTKASADMYYSIRTIFPQLFLKDNVRNPLIQNTWNVYYCFSLPKLFNNHRITIYKIIDSDPNQYDGLISVTREMYASTVRLLEDYDEGQITLVDLQGYSLAHALRFTPTTMKISAFILENLYSNNLRGIHFINAPNMAEYLMAIFKTFAPPKILKRIHIHKNLESLHKMIPVDYLPVEMGGTEFSLKELNEKWRDKLESYYDILTTLDSLAPDESLRPVKSKDNVENVFGIDGNFRKLTVD